jgi:uncharacterized protein
MLSADDAKKWLKLTPNLQEGGFLAGVYNSTIHLPDKVLKGFPPTKNGRELCGAIYYFLDTSGGSVLHRVTGDMIYHFYCGDAVQMLLLYPGDGPNSSEVCVFGNNLSLGQNPMKAIPGGTWLGSRLLPAGSWALMGVTMAPGFDPADYTIGVRSKLIKEYPDQAGLIPEFTRDG